MNGQLWFYEGYEMGCLIILAATATRNQYPIVRQTDFPIYDGIHEAIILKDEWKLAQEKRKRTGVKNKRVYSTKHQHILPGIVCCPGLQRKNVWQRQSKKETGRPDFEEYQFSFSYHLRWGKRDEDQLGQEKSGRNGGIDEENQAATIRKRLH